MNKLDEIREKWMHLTSFDPENLVAVKVGTTTYDLSAAVPSVKQLVDFYLGIDIKMLSAMPDGWHDNLKNRLVSDWNTISNAMNITKEQDTNHVVNSLRNLYADTITSINYIYFFCALRKLDLDSLRDRMGEIVDSTMEAINTSKEESAAFLDKSKKEIEVVKSEAEKIMDGLRGASASKGVELQSNRFAGEVTKHQTAADAWFKITVGSFGVLVAVAIASFWFTTSDSAFANVQLAVSKFILMAVLTYATVQSAKNFYSHKHNAEVNQHRQNAILSYQFFVDAAKEVEVKSAIIAYVAANVFSPQDTGFITSAINIEMPKNPVELIMKATETKGAAPH